jgi:hypothetical protein
LKVIYIPFFQFFLYTRFDRSQRQSDPFRATLITQPFRLPARILSSQLSSRAIRTQC